MVFTKHLREGIRRGRIRCSVRIWTRPHVKAGGQYPMDEGHIIVESIKPIRLRDITEDLALESGFPSVKDLLEMAKHGRGENVYLIRFRYLPAGAWHVPGTKGDEPGDQRTESGSRIATRSKSQLLRRIRESAPPEAVRGGRSARKSRRRGE